MAEEHDQNDQEMDREIEASQGRPSPARTSPEDHDAARELALVLAEALDDAKCEQISIIVIPMAVAALVLPPLWGVWAKGRDKRNNSQKWKNSFSATSQTLLEILGT